MYAWNCKMLHPWPDDTRRPGRGLVIFGRESYDISFSSQPLVSDFSIEVRKRRVPRTAEA
jgi:hypothetical protein